MIPIISFNIKKDSKDLILYVMKNTNFDLAFIIKVKLMYFSYKPYGLLKPIIKNVVRR